YPKSAAHFPSQYSASPNAQPIHIITSTTQRRCLLAIDPLSIRLSTSHPLSFASLKHRNERLLTTHSR
ncbi:hypothetical protein, partial [Sporisorium scitamineum]